MEIDYSIVLPVFNEEKNLPLIVEKFVEISKNVNVEVLFVEDGGSSDNTRDALIKINEKHPFIKYVFTNERGYGISIYNGLKKAKGEFICWTHADMQTDPKDTLKAFNLIKKQKNAKKSFVKGKRYGRPLFDSFFTFGMSIFETLLLGTFLYDINAQPNFFHKSFLGIMNNPPKDFSFDLYVYHLAKKKKFKTIRFPVHFGERIYGESAWNDGFKARVKFIKRTIKFSLELKKNI